MTACILFCILLLKYRKYSMHFGQSILNTLTIKYMYFKIPFLPREHMRGRFWESYFVCLSVCPSVRLSHAWIVAKLNDAVRIFWYHTKVQSLCYSNTNSGWWATFPSLWNLRSKWPTPFEKRRLQHISAYNVSIVRDSEKKFHYDEYKVDHGLSNEL